MALYVVMLGPPGSGKGTQAKRLAAAFHVPHISTGDMFRAMQTDTSELAQRVRAIMERGELVPDALTIEMVRERLKKPDARAGAIFDGFPRTIEQATALDAMLKEIYDEQIDVALLLNVPEDEITRRILKRAEVEGRADDTEEVIHKRHQTYLEQTTPLIDYFGRQGKLVEVDGNRPIEAITEDLIAQINIATGSF
ncbi:MAG: adenylate kinase [Aggregatilineales bacterium]|nr:adenylate kinase [Chloroflexota bacterium]HOA25478.1 adenylate kinase [Aggregatilineales bacterium]HPV06906.1 adenylate kinase [Aggregatilineales bacterium]HQE19058.1 adenylate kinase [Aggregatilineales bacterium]